MSVTMGFNMNKTYEINANGTIEGQIRTINNASKTAKRIESKK